MQPDKTRFTGKTIFGAVKELALNHPEMTTEEIYNTIRPTWPHAYSVWLRNKVCRYRAAAKHDAKTKDRP